MGMPRIKVAGTVITLPKLLGIPLWKMLAESAARILMEGPTKHGGKDYWFSADVLTARQVAETLAEATGRKFTAAVRTAEAFQSEGGTARSIFEPAYAKGGLEFFPLRRGWKNGVRLEA